MKTLWEFIVRAADAGGAASGAGGASPPVGGGANGAGQQPEGANPPPAGSGTTDPPAGPYRPEGLPETMYGKDDRETLDKMATALKGYRQRDSAIPDKPDAYSAFQLDAVPETIRGHIGDLAKDPLFAKAAAVALAEKVPVPAFQKLTQSLYEAAQEAGILEPHLNAQAERAALLPDDAKALPKEGQDKAIDARLKRNEDFVKLMTTQGLPMDVAEHGLLMLMDTAKGNRLIEYFAGKITGGDRPQPFAGGGGTAPGGQDERAALRAELAKPELQPGHRLFSKAKYDEVNERYKKLVGNGPA